MCLVEIAFDRVLRPHRGRDPTTGFFLHRFVVDHYLRRQGTVREYWERSLWFLTPEVANAA